jgi:hypothetical protein
VDSNVRRLYQSLSDFHLANASTGPCKRPQSPTGGRFSRDVAFVDRDFWMGNCRTGT